MALTQTDLDAINRAIARGELTVRAFNGSQVTYRSMDELLKAREAALADIRSAAGAAPGARHRLADFSD